MKVCPILPLTFTTLSLPNTIILLSLLSRFETPFVTVPEVYLKHFKLDLIQYLELLLISNNLIPLLLELLLVLHLFLRRLKFDSLRYSHYSICHRVCVSD